MTDIVFESLGLTVYVGVIMVALGLVMGSFLNCVAWRLVRGEHWMSGRSHCDTCGHVLAARDLIPLVSWLSTKGRCRYCKERISVRNPLTELVCALVYVCVWRYYGLELVSFEMLGFASVLLVIALVDIDARMIPNGCIVCAVMIRVAYFFGVWVMGTNPIYAIADSLISAIVILVPLLLMVVVMDHVLGCPSMGGGDLKLLAVAGFYFGWQRCLFMIVVACVLGIVYGIMGQRKAAGAALDEVEVAHDSAAEPTAGAALDEVEVAHDSAAEPTAGVYTSPREVNDEKNSDDVSKYTFPFGPAIAISCIITMLFGDQALGWYLGLLL